MNRRGLTYIEVIVAIIIIGVLAILLTPTICRGRHRSKTTRCANNLSQLWKMQYNYRAMFGHHSGMPRDTGSEFWLRLSKSPTVLIDDTLKDMYQCPLTSHSRGCDYRGPSSNVNTYSDGDPVGADIEGNHGTEEGGNVLRRSGDVLPVGKGDSLWELARKKTTGGNSAWPGQHAPDESRTREPRFWIIVTLLGFMALMLIVKLARPSRVEPRSIAFWTAFFGLGGSALFLMA